MQYREEWKTYSDIFSKSTINALIKLAQQHIYDELLSRVSMGKEAVVLAAKSKLYGIVAVKVYMIETCNFRRMYEYLSQDNRYINLPKNRRKIVYTWTEREYKNLEIAYRSGALVPRPLVQHANILVMQFIGNVGNATPYPLLKDIHKNIEVDSNFYRNAYTAIIENYKKLVQVGLVHGDLSEYNILVKDENTPYFIDFSQGTIKKSLNYFDLLKRDIEKLSAYFSKFFSITPEQVAKELDVWEQVKNL